VPICDDCLRPVPWTDSNSRCTECADEISPGRPSESMTDAEVIAALLHCVECWEPKARLLANLRAGDIARALRSQVPGLAATDARSTS
jgi:hypothetical protein